MGHLVATSIIVTARYRENSRWESGDWPLQQLQAISTMLGMRDIGT